MMTAPGHATSDPHPYFLRKSYYEKSLQGVHISLIRNDLTAQDTNAIVNAANGWLMLGGGVAGAIREIGGDAIQDECDKLVEDHKGRYETGEVVATGIGKFTNKDLKYIFHAVGPVYYGGKNNERQELEKTFLNCFLLGDKLELASIALPPISSGIFGYPKMECAEVYFYTLIDYIKTKRNAQSTLKDIRMVIIDWSTFNYFVHIYKKKEEDFKEIEDPSIEEKSESSTNTNTNINNNLIGEESQESTKEKDNDVAEMLPSSQGQ